jgi:tellurite resistance protein
MKNCLRLRNFPISFFAPVLGFAGFSLALQKIELMFFISNMWSLSLLIITIILFVIILIAYLLKFLVFYSEVVKEYQHPIKINFFPLISKILLVLSVVFLSINMIASKWLWIIGVIINTIFTLSILGEWISKEHFRIEHISPAWFIPVVGNLIVPIAGMQHFPAEISWFFFSIGITWMFILTTIVLYRLIFHEPLAKKLVPTFFILFAAPAIAFIAYYKLTNSFDAFAHILFQHFYCF